MSNGEIRLACGLLDWSYTEMAKNIGVTPMAVSKWATGVNKVPKTVTMLIHKLLEEHDVIDEFNSVSDKKFRTPEHQLASGQ